MSITESLHCHSSFTVHCKAINSETNNTFTVSTTTNYFTSAAAAQTYEDQPTTLIAINYDIYCEFVYFPNSAAWRKFCSANCDRVNSSLQMQLVLMKIYRETLLLLLSFVSIFILLLDNKMTQPQLYSLRLT